MLKIVLENLIAEYTASLRFFESEDKRISLLKEFLYTNEIASLSDDHDITFENFVDYVSNKLPENEYNHLFHQTYWKSNNKSVSVLEKFLHSDARIYDQKQNKFTFRNVVPDLRDFTTYLNATDVKNLAVTSSTMFSESKSIDYWKDKLLEVGCNLDVLNEVIQMGVITNYQKLYQSFVHINSLTRASIQNYDTLCLKVDMITKPWQLLLLSGEAAAINKAIELGLPDKETPEFKQVKQYIALSGNPKAIERLFELNSNLNKNYLARVLEYAALSGNPEAIKAALKLGLKADLDSCIYAALSGNPKAASCFAKIRCQS